VRGEWKAVALDEVATIERDAIQPGAICQGTAYLGLEHIESGGKILTAKPVTEGELASSKFKFTERHLLYGKLRPYLAKIACPDFTGICSTDILPILPGPHLDRRFLCYFLRQPSMVDYANSRATGANLPRLSPSALARLEIPLPPLAEQRRIAEVLDKAEALRAKRRAALAQLDSLTQSLFLDLFGDPATNPKGWPLKPVGSLASKFSDGPFGSNLKSEHYTEIGVRVIRLQNIGVGEFVDDDAAYISEQHFAKLKKHDCRPGDVLVGTMGDPNLRACIQPDWLPVALNKADCVQLRPDERIANSIFICALLNQPATERMAHDLMQGQTRVRISMGRLRGLEVPLPPLDLQHEFARRVAAVEKLKTAQRAALAELDALFASLQHRAFRGEL
jgi:type I restriction enzyme S subunit